MVFPFFFSYLLPILFDTSSCPNPCSILYAPQTTNISYVVDFERRECKHLYSIPGSKPDCDCLQWYTLLFTPIDYSNKSDSKGA